MSVLARAVLHQLHEAQVRFFLPMLHLGLQALPPAFQPVGGKALVPSLGESRFGRGS